MTDKEDSLEGEETIEQTVPVEVQVKVDFEAQAGIIAQALENKQPITDEQVAKARKIVDQLLSTVKRFDENQLGQYCDEYQIDVRGVDYHHFDESFLEASNARSYLIKQEKLVTAYLKWIDKCHELLSAFVLLNSQDQDSDTKKKAKTGDIKKAEIVVKLQDLTLKRQKYEDLLFSVQGTREAVDAARDDLSRVLGYWQNKENLSLNRNIPLDRKR